MKEKGLFTYTFQNTLLITFIKVVSFTYLSSLHFTSLSMWRAPLHFIFSFFFFIKLSQGLGGIFPHGCLLACLLAYLPIYLIIGGRSTRHIEVLGRKMRGDGEGGPGEDNV